MNWQLINCGFGAYMLVSSEGSIKLEIESDYNNLEINISSKDMSKDGVIFINNIYQTPSDESRAIIGDIYIYSNKRCSAQGLVGVKILSATVQNPKEVVEDFWS